MDLLFVKTALKKCNMRDVSKTTGLSYNTVVNIKNGKNKNPKLETIDKLKGYLINKIDI